MVSPQETPPYLEYQETAVFTESGVQVMRMQESLLANTLSNGSPKVVETAEIKTITQINLFILFFNSLKYLDPFGCESYLVVIAFVVKKTLAGNRIAVWRFGKLF